MGNSFVAEWGSSIEFGDCLEIMRNWPDQCVQMCVTSPPYWGLRDYGVAGQLGLESTPQEYVEKMVAVFREVRRVLRDDGTLWLNLGDSYGTGTTAPRKQGSRGLGASTQEAQDAVPRCGGMAKQLIGIPWRVSLALQADGWYLRQDIIWAKPNPMPESVRDRCTKSHEYIFLLSKNERYYFDAEAMQEPANPQNYRPNPTVREIPPGSTRQGKMDDRRGEVRCDTRNKRSVWTVSTKPFKGAHFATFPPDLIEPCILAGSRPGDTVLDPFMGSGTTAMVAQRHGRKYRGCELQENYRDLQVARIGAPKTADLFGNT